MTTNQDRLDLLVLARAAVKAAKPPARAAIAKAIGPLVDGATSGAAINNLIDDATTRLRARGELNADRFVASDAGRERLLHVFGFETTPRWQTFKSRHLVALALGLPLSSQAVQNRLKTPDGVFGLVLAKHHDLGLAEAPTLKQAVDALVWRQLRVETLEKLTLAKVKALLVGRALGSDTPVAAAKVGRVAASVAAGAKRPSADAVREALFRRWLANGDADGDADKRRPAEALPVRPGASEMPLDAFVERVRAAARGESNGRFGDRKVFISAVWRAVRDELIRQGIDERGFKQRLLDANRAGLIHLHRADLVGAMDPTEVAASEIHHLNAVYHFVEEGGAR